MVDWDKVKKLEISVSPSGGMSFKADPSVPGDVESLALLIKNHKEDLKEIVAAQSPPQSAAPAHPLAQYSATFESLLPGYVERRKREVSGSTLDQYVSNLRKFLAWAEGRDGLKPLLMRHLDKRLVSQYIACLQKSGHSNQNIDHKHLMPLNTFFDFATSVGEYPDVPSPSRGHKLKTSMEDELDKEEREPFTPDELRKIFNPETHLENEYPDGFWLPILALFTGARLNELCKLSVLDVAERDGVPSIQFTVEYGSLKNKASKRTIPLHPQILELGFMDYVADVKKFGGMVFPGLLPNKSGSFIKEPSRRFGAYLDKIGITDPGKVFHSFRSTATDTLKQNGITLEERNDFIGHEQTSTNSKYYTKEYRLRYLAENVLPKLTYDLDLSPLRYEKGRFERYLRQRMKTVSSILARRESSRQNISAT